MKVIVQTYRGYDISFDPDKDKFSSVLSESDDYRIKESKSFSAVKKAIDEYIKENVSFKPFKIVGGPQAWNNQGKIYEVTGIRKDNRFIVNKNGNQEQLSQYDENKYFIVEGEDFEKDLVRIQYLESLLDDASKEVNKAQKEFDQKYTKLADIKSNYIQK